MAIKHTFVSAVSDGADASLVRPSNWNEDHIIDSDVIFGGFDADNIGAIGIGANSTVLDAINIEKAHPQIRIKETDAALDEKVWKVYAEDGYLYLSTVTDDGLTSATALVFGRNAGVVDEIGFSSLRVQFNESIIQATGASLSLPSIYLQRDNAGGAVLDTHGIGWLRFRGHDGSAYADGAFIRAQAAENWSGVAHGGRLLFGATPIGTTSGLDYWQLDPDGVFGPVSGNGATAGGDWKFTGSMEFEAGTPRITLDTTGTGQVGIEMQEGGAFRYKFFYDPSNNRCTIHSFDVDGVGADGDVMQIADGQGVVDFPFGVRGLSGRALVNVAARDGSVTVANTASESNLVSVTVPANTFTADGNQRVRLVVTGLYFNNTGSDQTLRVRVKFGGTTWADETITAISSGGNSRSWQAIVLVSEIPSSAQQDNSAWLYMSSTDAPFLGTGNWTNTPAAFGVVRGLTSATESSGNTLQITVQHSAASASLSITKYTAILEVM